MNLHQNPQSLPMVVCPGCRGEGTHANPAFDGMSLSLDTFEGDYEEMRDFAREYTRRGSMYDVVCSECNGRNVVRAVCDCADCERTREEDAEDARVERFERMYC